MGCTPLQYQTLQIGDKTERGVASVSVRALEILIGFDTKTKDRPLKVDLREVEDKPARIESPGQKNKNIY